MTLRIRSAIAADAPALADFMLEEWDRAHRGILADGLLDARLAEAPEERRRRWRTRIDEGAVLVAELEGRLVGTVRRHDVGGELGPLISSLAVAAAARRRGIGARLVSASVADEPAHLWVFERAEQARRFHERQGFRADGAERMDLFGPELRMVRSAR